ncbi:hypothetical protein QQ045_006197 [Rhodiola kirilowii]
MEQREQDEGAMLMLSSSRHDLTTESSDDEEVRVDHIKVGSYYEIDHSKLPLSSPVQLQSVKIVMVCAKSEQRGVSVRYPSTFSLKSHFRSGNSGNGSRGGGSVTTMQKSARMNPALDEKYSMENKVAAMALFRRVKPEEFVKLRGLVSFWAVGQSGSHTRRIPTRSSSGATKLITGSCSGGGGSGLTVYQRTARNSRSGSCLLALKSGKVVRWGRRQKVRFISNEGSAAEVIKEKIEDEDVDGKAVSDQEMRLAIPLRRNGKRKCKVVSCNQQIRLPKKLKRETIVMRKIGMARGQKRRGHKDSINRWSADRYKLAEENMLKIMREKRAVFERPMLRQTLRDEARKVIGDTGLLDHLLKHMSGKVAPGGAERFRRRHNAEGAMEYWLESADLVEIRKMAGVSDPYWKPPPGWKLGDNPSQDPVCAMEITQLKEEVDKLKRDLNEYLLPKGQAEADIGATTPLSCVSEQNLITDTEALPLKELHEELVKRKFRLEKQMMKVSQYLTEMEEEMDKLSKVEKAAKSGSDGAGGCSTLGTENNDAAGNNDGKSRTQQQEMGSPGKEDEVKNTSPAEAAAAKAEEKAAKIQKLKSGFRICQPQGSFKWPNMAAAAAVVVSPMPDSSKTSSSSGQIFSPTALEYLMAAQTPPSVSSSTTKSPSLPFTRSVPPVKPFARRHAAAATSELLQSQAARITSNFQPFIDLNYTPPATNQNEGTRFHASSNHNVVVISRDSASHNVGSSV